MRPGVFGIVALAVAVSAAPSRADEPQTRRGQQQRQQQSEAMRFRGMDRNGDGQISRQEWRGNVQSFRQHDWNADGVLSGDEVRVGAQRPRDSRDTRDTYDTRGTRAYQDWTAEAFADFDADRNGRLTPNEWQYDRESWVRADRNSDNALSRREFLDAATVDMARESRFDELDANNNNRIERAEWRGTTEGFRWLDRDNDGRLSRTEMLGEDETETSTTTFDTLDTNRNGTLSQAEWQWSRREFLQQDRNRDGVLSRAEFTEPTTPVTGTTGTSGRVTERTIDVNSQERWVDTGIDLNAGDTVAISAEGSIRMSGNWSDTSSAAGSNRRAANAPLPNHPAGALIARVGTGTPIFIGDSGGARNVVSGGRLYLSVNDDHLGDNVGSFRVTVTVNR